MDLHKSINENTRKLLNEIPVYELKLTIRNIYQTKFFQCNEFYCWETILNNKDKRNNEENMLTEI